MTRMHICNMQHSLHEEQQRVRRTILLISLEAGLDPRTTEKVLRGDVTVRQSSFERAVEALARHGLEFVTTPKGTQQP